MPYQMTRQLANFMRDEFRKGRIRREPPAGTFSTMVGDMMTFHLEEDDFWQALHITQISIAPPHTFNTYDILLRDGWSNMRELVQGTDYTIEDNGLFLSFTKPIRGPIDVVFRHRPPAPPKFKLILVPWYVGSKKYSKKYMEHMARSCVGQIYPVNQRQVPKEFEGYKSMKVLEATLTENGVEAVVQFQQEDV